MALYDGIVAAKQDRLSRADWSDEARIRLWAEENGKTLFIVDRNLRWPPRDADDRERWNNGAEQARREWESTSKRYRRMQKHLRDQQFFVGKPPYGYQIVKVDGTDHKTLIPDPVKSLTVKEMARRYLAGHSLREIIEWLTAASIPAPRPPKERTGKGWTPQAVRRILRNPAIAGRVQVKGRTVLRVESLTSMEDYRRIESLMESRATRGAPKDTALLTGIVFCGNGHPMYRDAPRPRSADPAASAGGITPAREIEAVGESLGELVITDELVTSVNGAGAIQDGRTAGPRS